MKKSALYLSLTVFVVFLFAGSAFADDLKGTPGNAFQTWNSGNVDHNLSPYWDGVSFNGLTTDIGNYMTKTGAFSSGIPLTSYGNNGPGVAYPFWGGSFNSGSTPDSGGAADPNFYFQKTGTNQQLTFQFELTNQDGYHPGIPGNTFGWFETNSTGTLLGALHQIYDANTQTPAVGPTAFSPTDFFGFYLSNTERGTFYTLSKFDTSDTGATFGNDYQHFTAFLNSNTNTFWFGIEDLVEGGVTPPTGDADYRDMVVTFSSTPIPEPATMLLLGSGLIGLAGFARRKFRK